MDWKALLCLFFISLALSTATDTGDVDLSGGSSAAEGVLRVYYNGRWGYVCDDTAGSGTLAAIAQVACSLKIFSDPSFTTMINNGATISIAKGRNLFGDIGVKSTDENLRVGIDDCRISRSNNPSDNSGQLVIESGCKTVYGASVLTQNRFGLLTHFFSQPHGQNVYLYCSVVVCGLEDMSRCTRRCPSVSGRDGVVGKRSKVKRSNDGVIVSAGPFFIQ